MIFTRITSAKQLLMLLTLPLAIVSCSKDNNEQAPAQKITYGAFVKVGNGQARSYVISNPDGTPGKIGLTFTEGALEGLPSHNTPFKLPMPAGNPTLVNHISLDYSIHGHGPEGIYDVPHFDIHFYMLSEKEVDAITLDDPKIDMLPPVQHIPKNYVPGANEPKMGKHWADTTAHEWHGHDFTSTFIYGSYNGRFHFLEPMVAFSYLKTKPNETFAIEQQPKVQQTGSYPQKYTIAWEKDDKIYNISLNTLTLRQP